MSRASYRYVFARSVSFTEVREALELASNAVESLHGESKCCLDARVADDPATNTVSIEGGTEVGDALNRVFMGFARRQFGGESFRVDRLDGAPADSQLAAMSA